MSFEVEKNYSLSDAVILTVKALEPLVKGDRVEIVNGTEAQKSAIGAWVVTDPRPVETGCYCEVREGYFQASTGGGGSTYNGEDAVKGVTGPDANGVITFTKGDGSTETINVNDIRLSGASYNQATKSLELSVQDEEGNNTGSFTVPIADLLNAPFDRFLGFYDPNANGGAIPTADLGGWYLVVADGVFGGPLSGGPNVNNGDKVQWIDSNGSADPQNDATGWAVFEGNIQISPDSGNILERRANGLYVPTPSLPTTSGEYKGELNASTDSLPTTAVEGDFYYINTAGDNLGNIEQVDYLNEGDLVVYLNLQGDNDPTNAQNWVGQQRNTDDRFTNLVSIEDDVQTVNLVANTPLNVLGQNLFFGDIRDVTLRDSNDFDITSGVSIQYFPKPNAGSPPFVTLESNVNINGVKVYLRGRPA